MLEILKPIALISFSSVSFTEEEIAELGLQ